MIIIKKTGSLETRLLETNACSLSCHCTVLLFCVAIDARAPFEGVMTSDSYQACA